MAEPQIFVPNIVIDKGATGAFLSADLEKALLMRAQTVDAYEYASDAKDAPLVSSNRKIITQEEIDSWKAIDPNKKYYAVRGSDDQKEPAVARYQGLDIIQIDGLKLRQTLTYFWATVCYETKDPELKALARKAELAALPNTKGIDEEILSVQNSAHLINTVQGYIGFKQLRAKGVKFEPVGQSTGAPAPAKTSPTTGAVDFEKNMKLLDALANNPDVKALQELHNPVDNTLAVVGGGLSRAKLKKKRRLVQRKWCLANSLTALSNIKRADLRQPFCILGNEREGRRGLFRSFFLLGFIFLHFVFFHFIFFHNFFCLRASSWSSVSCSFNSRLGGGGHFIFSKSRRSDQAKGSDKSKSFGHVSNPLVCLSCPPIGNKCI
jgi:hypothetical protein